MDKSNSITRRDFISKTTASTAALALAPVSSLLANQSAYAPQILVHISPTPPRTKLLAGLIFCASAFHRASYVRRRCEPRPAGFYL